MVTIDDKILKQSPIAEGGEGIIYEINDTILKVYKNTVDKNEKLNKIKSLMSKQLPSNIIKPIDVAYDSNHKFIGYTMKKVDGEEFKRLTNKKFLQLNNITTKDILKMLVDIKVSLVELHKHNIFISDLNDCNILFDKNFNVYFIDCDSWSIDKYKCSVAMDSFKDPLMVGNNFSEKTDVFALGVLAFKSLTRIHPFGGTTNPDMDIITRMKKGISVIGNTNVVIPKTINKWDNLSPKFVMEVKDIFETKNRDMINSLEDFYQNLKYCDVHQEYYYSKFNECPLCNGKAKIVVKPIQLVNSNGVPIMLFFTDYDVKTILSSDTYVDLDDNICHIKSKTKIKYIKGNEYYFSDDGSIIYTVTNKIVTVNTYNNVYSFDKTNKSNIVARGNKLYLVALNNNLIEITIDKNGNYTKNIAKVSFNNIFEVINDKNYFICNTYDKMLIINVSGYNITIDNNFKIVNYGLHFDSVTERWLFIVETAKGDFITWVFKKNMIEYNSDSIKYSNSLDGMCFNNGVIFKPCDGFIKGFSYVKNVYKDFDCNIVNEDSKISKEGTKFTVINEKEIYKLG
jgi:serine/threonine protein kinase